MTDVPSKMFHFDEWSVCGDRVPGLGLVGSVLARGRSPFLPLEKKPGAPRKSYPSGVGDKVMIDCILKLV